MSKDRSKEILREISSLKREIEGRLDAIEARLDPSAADTKRSGPAASVSSFSFPSGPDLTPKGVDSSPGLGHGEQTSDTVWPEAAASGAPREVSLRVRPLVDVGVARAIESSLSETDGIESARLASLSGDSAVIQALVAPGVSVVNTLRRRLPVAFDVTESSDHAISIELATTDHDEPYLQTETETDH